jgi:hypothetical protein
MNEKPVSVSVRLATPDDAHLETYDNTKLSAVNTCPTWGIVTYQMHLVNAQRGRAMPLEAGSACHEVFAAVRLWQLWKYDLPPVHDLNRADTPELIHPLVLFHGDRLFPNGRFKDMLEEVKPGEDERTNCLNFCLQALYSSGFYDDPYDTRRTMANLEEAMIMYIDRWDFKRMPIWIRDINDPQSDIGIEIAFDVVITYTFPDGSERSYRFTGKLDGIQWRDAILHAGENKTASRLDDAWRLSFEMSSQVTGYCLAATVFTQHTVDRAVVWGVSIPLPKTYDQGGLVSEHVRRPSHMFAHWFDWFLYSVRVYETYRNDPTNAPKFTHSCNRYFRACSLIPFCTADDEEQQLALSEMVHHEWTPLDSKAGD